MTSLLPTRHNVKIYKTNKAQIEPFYLFQHYWKYHYFKVLIKVELQQNIRTDQKNLLSFLLIEKAFLF